jgi:hypothetical protein
MRVACFCGIQPVPDLEVFLMITVPASWKDCVTCERWGGQRKPTPFRDGVEYDPSRDNGECLGGGWDRMQIGAMQTCNRYKKWRALSIGLA